MPHLPESIELTLPVDAPDPELEALPEPRRPWRKPTLVALGITGLAALGMAFALRAEAAYALGGGPPLDIGDLAAWVPNGNPGGGNLGNATSLGGAVDNRWVRAEGSLSSTGAIRYSRPLDGDSFRLAPISGNERVWVEVRVPAGLEGPHFVPPASFVGRLIPWDQAGMRHSSLGPEVARITSQTVPPDAWLLVDGESPKGVRWALGLIALFIGFAGFSAFGLHQLLRPIRDA